MTDENILYSYVDWAFKGVVALLFLVGGWCWNKADRNMEGFQGEMKTIRANFADHKLESEKRFAKEEHVNESFKAFTTSLNNLSNAINTNTSMTGVIMEKISSINERLKP